MSHNINLLWKGSEDPEIKSGIAIFKANDYELSMPFESRNDAHNLYKLMLEVADISYENGRKSIKHQIERL